MNELFGQVLKGTHRSEKVIGESGRGAVHQVSHPRPTGRFAIKMLFPTLAALAPLSLWSCARPSPSPLSSDRAGKAIDGRAQLEAAQPNRRAVSIDPTDAQDLRAWLHDALEHPGLEGATTALFLDGYESRLKGRWREAFPFIRSFAEDPGPETLRVGATLLLGEVLWNHAELLSKAPDYNDKRRILMLKLAHDSIPAVAAAASLWILATVSRDELPPLRLELAGTAAGIEKRVTADWGYGDILGQRALLRLQGSRRAVSWLRELLAGRREILVGVKELAQEVIDDPMAEAFQPLEALLRANPNVIADRKPWRMGLVKGEGNEDRDSQHARACFQALVAVDPGRARKLLSSVVGPQLKPILAVYLKKGPLKKGAKPRTTKK
jgi:hypothetical protein